MAIKKSELYSTIWESCNQLRGSMDASQYKDYVLVLLFMKYVSDKGGALVEIPKGASFYDMVKLKGKTDIGEKINDIITKLAKANGLTGIIDEADFDDNQKLGEPKAKVDLLSKLIEVFENEDLDFSKNRASDDDLLGDAYEFLMRHFATESGKSKGQFYTPAEVSRIMAKVIGIGQSKSQTETLYDPTCGSGSLLLKAADEAPKGISIYGQELDNATRALAVMNMWLHGNQTSEIVQGNTLNNPLFKDIKTGGLKTFDYVVANPKFSDKAWTNGLKPANDEYKRFDGYKVPPKKNGDFAYLLHILKSMKSGKGKGAVILPLGVLFRGNAEADIRKKLVEQRYIKGIIGLPANLFYGTSIAACIIVLDKEGAAHRSGIFMIDAAKGFRKDGPKNRLREQDLHKIVDTFNTQTYIPKYSRMVPISEIAEPKNDYNLNIARYIDSQVAEDIQDIEAHLLGDIPNKDIEDLGKYWEVYSTLKTQLFVPATRSNNYCQLNISKEEIRHTIYHHPEFTTFSKQMDSVFESWRKQNAVYVKALTKGFHPKQEVQHIAESILSAYNKKKLVDKYDVYQHLMNYSTDVLLDDLYELAADGWKVGKIVTRIIKKIKKGEKTIEKSVHGIEGLEGRLIPPPLLIQEYFSAEQKHINKLEEKKEAAIAKMIELEDEHLTEGGLLEEVKGLKGISKKNIEERAMAIKQEILDSADIPEADKKKASGIKKEFSKVKWQKGLKDEGDLFAELDVLHEYQSALEKETDMREQIKKAKATLEKIVLEKYPMLSVDEVKTIVVDKKWMVAIEQKIKAEMNSVSHRLTQRIKELAERYERPLPKMNNDLALLTDKVESHLKKMNFTW
jgi:type I restriction enzyme M protein